MASYNSLTIVGNCGNDPEMRYTPNGVPVTSINVAVNDGKMVDGEWKEKVEWFRVISFNKLAERVNDRVKKGMPVMVVGKLTLQRWEDKNSGEKRYTLEILANRVMTFGKDEKPVNAPTVIDEVQSNGDIEVEELPF
jgi:single-strand DNA-binding protein